MSTSERSGRASIDRSAAPGGRVRRSAWGGVSDGNLQNSANGSLRAKSASHVFEVGPREFRPKRTFSFPARSGNWEPCRPTKADSCTTAGDDFTDKAHRL